MSVIGFTLSSIANRTTISHAGACQLLLFLFSSVSPHSIVDAINNVVVRSNDRSVFFRWLVVDWSNRSGGNRFQTRWRNEPIEPVPPSWMDQFRRQQIERHAAKVTVWLKRKRGYLRGLGTAKCKSNNSKLTRANTPYDPLQWSQKHIWVSHLCWSERWSFIHIDRLTDRRRWWSNDAFYVAITALIDPAPLFK